MIEPSALVILATALNRLYLFGAAAVVAWVHGVALRRGMLPKVH